MALNQIGEILKQTREAQGITLNQIGEATKISTKYLRAIENGEYDAIPGEVYLKGFIRNYANILGLDGEQMVAKFNELRQAHDSMALNQLERERRGRMEHDRLERRQTRMRIAARVVVIVAGVVLLGVALYYAAFSFGWKTPVAVPGP